MQTSFRLFALTSTILGLWSASPAFAQTPPQTPTPSPNSPEARGQYIATLGDCVACHGGAKGDFAGGLGLKTPFGTIYASNLTQDKDTGIGNWTSDQFYKAMHDGIAADGSHLYPAFPYPWFTKLTRGDVDDLYAYLKTVPAVSNKVPEPDLPGPLSIRATIAGWNALYFKEGEFTPDKSKSAEWNRGAYIVEGPAHCSQCHTPTNVAGGSDSSKAYQGGELDHWFAPNLTGDKRVGLGSWSAKNIADYLKNGQIDRTAAYGPMNDVIQNSTSKMTDADLAAIATYLKSIPAAGPGPASEKPGADVINAGKAVYAANCSTCHQDSGGGEPGRYPGLKGSSFLQADNPTSVIRLVLSGDSNDVSDQAMPSFADKLSDDQAAAVISYVRSSWGNSAPPVTASQVKDLRAAASADQ
ncbi:MAG TPA: cytochrome c [Stellaceae bacterium]|nr:cytochrome c [Stellaceae bacterium]